ncbi:general odorant-binding protein 28a-like [Culicoides brevitarsis]|uniref:general odorant-binding protein 28a-like n=1 Tax=Culicoides brevitarsis TaxID=469753 RepID=UPI00307C4926
MKITLFFVLLCGVLWLKEIKTEEDPNEGKIQMLEQMTEPCFEKDGSTREDFNYMVRKRNLPSTKPQKCLSACMHENFETIKDGKFNRESFEGMMKSVANDEKKYPIIEDIGATCEKIVDADRCELAGKLVTCYKEVAAKHGIDYHNL